MDEDELEETSVERVNKISNEENDDNKPVYGDDSNQSYYSSLLKIYFIFLIFSI